MAMRPEQLCPEALLPAGSRVLCAVSGGADSMCLLHLLWSRRAAWGLEVCAAHYEHGLRGEESLRDAAFVKDWCAQHEIPCELGHGDVRAFARERGLGIEEAARELRYAFLREAAARLGCDRIATAHNADDNAETLLLHLCRGAGGAGLGGIPPQRGRIVRPLLGCGRTEIEEYLTEHGVPHVEDSSNESDDCARNLLRHRVLPVLREVNPAFAEAAGRSARLLRQDEECLRALAEDFIDAHYDGGSLPVEALARLHPALSSRVLRALCARSLEQKHVDAALALCAGGGELAFLDLPGLRLRRERGRLYFVPEAESVCIPERPVVSGETLEIPEAGIRVTAEFTEYREEIHGLFKTYCFKSEAICGSIVCTGRRSGDRLRAAGRRCSKSLKALFAEADMTRAQRERTPVFRDERGILAVHGLAVAERCVPSKGDRVLCLRVEETEREEGDGYGKGD